MDGAHLKTKIDRIAMPIRLSIQAGEIEEGATVAHLDIGKSFAQRVEHVPARP